jgi:hypothetical protein
MNSLFSSIALFKSETPKKSSIKFNLKVNRNKNKYVKCITFKSCCNNNVSYNELYKKIQNMKNVSDVNAVVDIFENIDINTLSDLEYSEYTELYTLALHKKNEIFRREVIGKNVYYD